ncbi:MAG: protein kinase [Polyangiaceae bacterium]
MVARDPSGIVLGTVLKSKYRLDRIIGQGGMATVYAGVELASGRPVAIKVLKPELAQSKPAVARFLREARSAARVTSEFIAKVYDVDQLESGEPFIAMELLEGEDLGMLLERAGKIPYWVATNFILQACDAVRAAHAAGIVHRDIKPSNLFLCKGAGGRAALKVVDFGISKTPRGTDDSLTLTQGDSFLGSPRYMAPEQMLFAHEVDARADIWSLGCTLYRAITGAPPFDGDNLAQICAMVLSQRPDLASDRDPSVPRELALVLASALEKDREKRLATVDALMSALAPFATSPQAPASWPGSQPTSSAAAAVPSSTPRGGGAKTTLPLAAMSISQALPHAPAPVDPTVNGPIGRAREGVTTEEAGTLNAVLQPAGPAPAPTRQRSSVVPLLAGGLLLAGLTAVGGYFYAKRDAGAAPVPAATNERSASSSGQASNPVVTTASTTSATATASSISSQAESTTSASASFSAPTVGVTNTTRTNAPRPSASAPQTSTVVKTVTPPPTASNPFEWKQ